MPTAARHIALTVLCALVLLINKPMAATCTFSGTGNFSNAALWDFVPTTNDSILIKGTCSYDKTANNLVYGNLAIGDGNTNGI